MQKFNLDLSAPVGPLVLYAMQADSMSRFFAITVTDNGAAWTPPDGAAWTVRFGAPGMPAGWYDTITEVGGGTHPAVVVDENTATVEIAEQAVSTPGNNVLCVLVTDAQGYQIASWPFALNVQGVPGFDAPEATVYYNALTAQVAETLANAQAAAASATLAESWAVGGTGTRPGEDANNAQYWAQQAQQVSQGALGWFETEQALEAAHPTGQNGQWAIIGSTDTIWTWDSDTSAWVNTGNTADLSNYYTKAQADAAFATAAQGALAASAVQSVNGKTGTAVTLNASDVGAAPAANGVTVYIHVRSGAVNELTGTGANGRALMTADVQLGDTWTVNGQPVTAYMGADDATESMAGSPWNGKWVSFIVGDDTLNFDGGGSGNGVHIDTVAVKTGNTIKWIDGKIYPIWTKQVAIPDSVFATTGKKDVSLDEPDILAFTSYCSVFYVAASGTTTVFGQSRVDGGDVSPVISAQAEAQPTHLTYYVARANAELTKGIAIVEFIRSGEGV